MDLKREPKCPLFHDSEYAECLYNSDIQSHPTRKKKKKFNQGLVQGENEVWICTCIQAQTLIQGGQEECLNILATLKSKLPDVPLRNWEDKEQLKRSSCSFHFSYFQYSDVFVAMTLFLFESVLESIYMSSHVLTTKCLKRALNKPMMLEFHRSYFLLSDSS